jgi:uncharacterized protein YqkB
MKKLLLFISLFISFSCFSQELDGIWVSDDNELSFTFSGDSLYVDIAIDGCGITTYRLINRHNTLSGIIEYDAREIYLESYDKVLCRKVLITLRKISKNRYLITCHGSYKNGVYTTHDSCYINKLPVIN